MNDVETKKAFSKRSLHVLQYRRGNYRSFIFLLSFYSRAFWEEFESYWFAIAKEQRKLELKTILLGVTDTKCPLLNYLIVLGKLYLWNCRRDKSRPFFSSYKELVRRK